MRRREQNKGNELGRGKGREQETALRSTLSCLNGEEGQRYFVLLPGHKFAVRAVQDENPSCMMRHGTGRMGQGDPSLRFSHTSPAVKPGTITSLSPPCRTSTPSRTCASVVDIVLYGTTAHGADISNTLDSEYRAVNIEL